MILIIRQNPSIVAKMLRTISVSMVQNIRVTKIWVIEGLEILKVHMSLETKLQQFTLASMMQKSSLLPFYSQKKAAKIDLAGFLLPLRMESRMTIVKLIIK